VRQLKVAAAVQQLKVAAAVQQLKVAAAVQQLKVVLLAACGTGTTGSSKLLTWQCRAWS
jgi:hypothetical protein